MKMVDGKVVEAEPGENVPKHLRLLTPDPKRKGKTFAQFVAHLRKLGYEVEWNELTASDYGAPTSRKRFFLLARRDKRPIVWPAPTHGNPKSPAVQAGKLQPWRTAAEIIDWTIPCPSIFERKKPLAENTLKRISKGLQKFVLDNPEPFIVQVNHSGDNFRGQSVDEPMPTVTSKHGFGVVAPYIMCNNAENLGRDIKDPVPTITTGNRNFLTVPTLIQYHTEQSGREHRGQSVESPLQTVDAANRYGLAAATIIQFNNHCDGVDIQKPLPTITAQSNHFAEVRAMLIKYYGCGVGQPVDQPLDTITAKDRFGLVTVHGVNYQIVDIGLRMLTPRELYNAQGFPPDYEIEVDCYGNAYPKKEQVARCGNSVPPPFATALVRANWPEACGKEINTMAALNDAWAV
jgi:DNA (cytosine-5)-methyltransferase 1